MSYLSWLFSSLQAVWKKCCLERLEQKISFYTSYLMSCWAATWTLHFSWLKSSLQKGLQEKTWNRSVNYIVLQDKTFCEISITVIFLEHSGFSELWKKWDFDFACARLKKLSKLCWMSWEFQTHHLKPWSIQNRYFCIFCPGHSQKGWKKSRTGMFLTTRTFRMLEKSGFNQDLSGQY